MTARPWPVIMLGAYPRHWRDRYGAELQALVADLAAAGRGRLPMAADLLRGAAIAWLTEGRTHMSERIRGALLTVLWSWVAFAAVAAWFGRDLGEYPSAATYYELIRSVPAALTAYDVLLAAGVAGIASTAVAAIAFGIGAVRDAKATRRSRTYALMAVPPVVAAAWIGGLRLVLTQLSGTAMVVTGVLWLLAGVAGIAVATLAVTTIVRTCTFPATTWRIGVAAGALVTVAMVVATGATLAWGLAVRTGWAPTHPGTDGVGWMTVTALMAAATVRAAVALSRTRQAGRPAPAP